MSKHFLTLALFFCICIANSQNFVTVKGKIIDETSKLPLESATVFLTSKKDSTVIDYTISEKNGNFELKTRKNDQAVFLKVSYMGYKSFRKEINDLKENVELGFISLSENGTALDEVVIKGEAPPVRI